MARREYVSLSIPPTPHVHTSMDPDDVDAAIQRGGRVRLHVAELKCMAMFLLGPPSRVKSVCARKGRICNFNSIRANASHAKRRHDTRQDTRPARSMLSVYTWMRCCSRGSCFLWAARYIVLCAGTPPQSRDTENAGRTLIAEPRGDPVMQMCYSLNANA